MHRKSQGRGRDGRKQPSLPVSSPPAASFPAPHEVGLPGMHSTFLPPGFHRPGLWAHLQDSSWLLLWGPSLLCPITSSAFTSFRPLLWCPFLTTPCQIRTSFLPTPFTDPLSPPCFSSQPLCMCAFMCDCLPPLLEGPLPQCWDSVLFIPESRC